MSEIKAPAATWKRVLCEIGFGLIAAILAAILTYIYAEFFMDSHGDVVGAALGEIIITCAILVSLLVPWGVYLGGKLAGGRGTIKAIVIANIALLIIFFGITYFGPHLHSIGVAMAFAFPAVVLILPIALYEISHRKKLAEVSRS